MKFIPNLLEGLFTFNCKLLFNALMLFLDALFLLFTGVLGNWFRVINGLVFICGGGGGGGGCDGVMCATTVGGGVRGIVIFIGGGMDRLIGGLAVSTTSKSLESSLSL